MTKEAIKSEIKRLYEESGKFPKIERLSEITRLPMYRVTQLLKEFVEEGWLLRVGNWYRFPEQLLFTDTAEKPQTAPIAETKKLESKKPEHSIDPATVNILRWSMGAIGAGMIIVSAYYTAIWMSEYLPGFLAWFFSAIAVGFSVMAFESFIFFRSIKRNGIAMVFLFLWVVVLFFSIGSTVAGQYNKEIKNQIELADKSAASSGNLVVLNSKRANETRLNGTIASKQSRMAQLLGIMTGYEGKPLDQTYTDARWEYGKLDREITNLVATELKPVQAEIAGILATDPSLTVQKELPDFYGWLSKVFGSQTAWIKFLFFLFPAVLIDLLAPVGIAVFLFLKSYNKEKEKELD